MPTENKPAEPFQREDRYIVLKLNRLAKDEAEYLRDCQAKAMADCVVVERDWPEYHLVWAMLEHRMAGKPVPDFNLWRRADELQQRLNVVDERVDLLEGLLLRTLAYYTESCFPEDLLLEVRGALKLVELKPADAERDHQIPGTSGMRLNMLANQGE
jgi:hypothetical protein